MQHREIADARFKGILETLSDVAKVEVGAKLFGKRMSLILAPDKPKVEALKKKLERELSAEQREALRQKQLEAEAKLAAAEKAAAAQGAADDHDDDDDHDTAEGSVAANA